MGNVKNVCLKVKKQKIIPPLVTVIQVSYIMLTESQEHNSRSMKSNIVENNIHQDMSWEKRNICKLSRQKPPYGWRCLGGLF